MHERCCSNPQRSNLFLLPLLHVLLVTIPKLLKSVLKATGPVQRKADASALLEAK